MKKTVDVNIATEMILDAMLSRDVAGRRVVSPEIENSIASRAEAQMLTKRQLEVLNYVAKGLSTKDVARILNITADGVSAHLRTVFAKLGASTRAEAVSIAVRDRLINV